MVRYEDARAIRFDGGSPSSRRTDARVILHQQLTPSAFWTLPLYFVRGDTSSWVEKHVLTPQLLALIPGAGNTAIWPARGQALDSIAAGTTVVWAVASRVNWLRPVTRAVSGFVARVLARYVGSFAVGSAFAATGVGAAAAALIDAGLLAWAVRDLWSAKDNFIEVLLDEWFPS